MEIKKWLGDVAVVLTGVALVVVAVVTVLLAAHVRVSFDDAPRSAVPVPGPVARAEDDFVYEWVDGAYTIEDTVTGVEYIIVAPEGSYDVDWTGSDWILRPVE